MICFLTKEWHSYFAYIVNLFIKAYQRFLKQKNFKKHCVPDMACLFVFRAQGYYPDIYSAQEKWQEAGQKFRVLLIDWHLKFHLTCIVWVFTNIIEHTWEWVELPIINTLCQYRLTFQSVKFEIYSITRNSPTLKLKLSFGTNFLSNFLKGTTRLIFKLHY